MADFKGIKRSDLIIFGQAHYKSHGKGEETGIEGSSDKGIGVLGSGGTEGVFGIGDVGVYGYSPSGEGLFGDSQSATADAIKGTNRGSGTGRGVSGFSNTGQGVYGHSISNAGVVGESDKFDGVFGISHNPDAAGVSGHNPGGLAGFFDGNVWVSQKLTVGVDIVLANADCAEDFNVSDVALVEPGTVMVLGENEVLLPSHQAYDKRVAGVISGAGDYKPGIILDKQVSQQRRLPVALLGKVFCKVDAQFGAIEVGDLLTTSSTPGHAMRVNDQLKAFGTVIGKALRPLKEGQGLIPILIALQ